LRSGHPWIYRSDVVQAEVEFEAYSDESNPVVQVLLISADSAEL